MSMTTYTSKTRATPHQIANWLNEAHQWHRIAQDQRLSRSKLIQARGKTLSLLQKILSANPAHAAALQLKYRAEVAQGHLHAAFATLRQLLKSTAAAAPELLMEYASAALAVERFDEAEQAYCRVLEQQTDRADAYCGVARARLGRGDHAGAWLRAVSLYRKGYRSGDLYRVIEQSAPHLQCDRHDETNERLIVDLLNDSQINPESLSTLVASMLRHKYDLENPDAAIDIATCAIDPLLINGLMLTTLADASVEGLVAVLRQHLFLTACATGELEESLQGLVLAIAVHAQRTDYQCPVSVDEQTILDNLQFHIEASLDEGASPDDLVAALLLVSLYRPLYPERYSFKLLRWDLKAWPTRVQSVFKLNLYDYANEHALRHELHQSQQERELDLLSHGSKTAFPKWSLPELVQVWREMDGAASHLEDIAEPHILILGCGSGRRAVALAQYFPNAVILAVDDNAHDLAYAARQASEIGCDNIEFSFGYWKKELPILHTRFDLVECTAFVPNPTRNWCEQLKRLVSERGHISLRDNAIRLPATVDLTTVPLPHSDRFAHWREDLLRSHPASLTLETRQGLFNREGARRLLSPAAQGVDDLANTLIRNGITHLHGSRDDGSEADTTNSETSHSLAV